MVTFLNATGMTICDMDWLPFFYSNAVDRLAAQLPVGWRFLSPPSADQALPVQNGSSSVVWNRVIFNNNFEVVRTDLWRANVKIRDLLIYFLQTGLLYAYRWGDAPIHTLLVTYGLNVSEVVAIPTSYAHAKWCYYSSSTLVQDCRDYKCKSPSCGYQHFAQESGTSPTCPNLCGYNLSDSCLNFTNPLLNSSFC
jgi:hypothetical protein